VRTDRKVEIRREGNRLRYPWAGGHRGCLGDNPGLKGLSDPLIDRMAHPEIVGLNDQTRGGHFVYPF